MAIQYRGYGTTVGHVDEGLDAFERELYTRWMTPPGRVLLIGCGAGRDLIGLARLGYEVTGVERSSELVDAARTHLNRHRVAATVTLGAIESAPVERQYDAVVFSPSCYSNIQSARRRTAVLAGLVPRLAPGARLIIHYIASDIRSPAAALLVRATARLSAADWRPEAGDAFARYHNSHGALMFNHVFASGEVEGECAAAGFRRVHEYVHTDRSNCIILERRPDESGAATGLQPR